MNDEAEIEEADVVVTHPIMDPADWGIYAICHMQVCAHSECPPELIEQRANELNPNGLRHAWKITTVSPSGTSLAPEPCAKFPGRLHHILVC